MEEISCSVQHGGCLGRAGSPRGAGGHPSPPLRWTGFARGLLHCALQQGNRWERVKALVGRACNAYKDLGTCPQTVSRPDPLPGLYREFQLWCWFVQLRAAREYELDTFLIDD